MSPGDLVFHKRYGVARFVGSVQIGVDGHTQEVRTLEFANGKLHAPPGRWHEFTPLEVDEDTELDAMPSPWDEWVRSLHG